MRAAWSSLWHVLFCLMNLYWCFQTPEHITSFFMLFWLPIMKAISALHLENAMCTDVVAGRCPAGTCHVSLPHWTLRYPEQGLTYLTVESHPILLPGLANSRFSIKMWTNDLKFKQREALFSEENLLLYYSYKTFMMGKLRDGEEFQELVGSIRLFVLFKILLKVKNKIWEDIVAILPTTHLPLTGD